MLISGFILLRKYTNIAPGNWEWSKQTTAKISWIPFYWTKDTFDGRPFEKTAIMVKTRIDNIPDTFICQLDLGSNITMLYENPVMSYRQLNKKSFYFSERIFGGRKHKCIRDIVCNLGNAVVKSRSVIVKEDYGDTVLTEDGFKIGTIGVDMFRDKILVIDFPRQRFCVQDEIAGDSIPFIPMELTASGFVLLPVKIGNRILKCLYDSGSSLFPILTSVDEVKDFSTNPVKDSFTIHSWGREEKVYTRDMDTTIQIAGNIYPDKQVYTINTIDNFLKENKVDAMVGNALFWHNTIVIDFKHRRFGIR